MKLLAKSLVYDEIRENKPAFRRILVFYAYICRAICTSTKKGSQKLFWRIIPYRQTNMNDLAGITSNKYVI